MKLLPPFLIFIIVLLIDHFLQAQEVFIPASRSQSLGGITVCLTDSWSVFGNQAGIAETVNPTISGTFQNFYLIKELSGRAGIFILPVQSSVIAISIYQFGETTFRQEKFGMTYARKLSPKLNFGIQFNYYRFYLAEENQTLNSYGIEMGLLYRLSQMILLGIHTINPYKVSINTFSGNYDYPSKINMGANIEISKSFGFFTEIEKSVSYPVNVKTGIEYNIMNKFYLRSGISGKPNLLSAGIGFEINKMKIDLAVAYNQQLGNSPSASFQYIF